MIPFLLGMTSHLSPDDNLFFQYTSPTPEVSVHLIPRIQYHSGIPVTLLTGSTFFSVKLQLNRTLSEIDVFVYITIKKKC